MNSFDKLGPAEFEVNSGDDVLQRTDPSEDRFLSHKVGSRSEVVTHQSGLLLRFQDAEPAMPETGGNRERDLRLKRLMDLFISSLAILSLVPLFVVISLVVKICSRGPIFFMQEREGLNRAPFKIFKFRTMDWHAGDPTGATQTVKDDPRVFAFGRFLRRTSIDELPQLINVLKGDMSLVGPRPHVSDMRAAGVSYRELVPYYDLRLMMKPGITGWAQVNGYRGPTQAATLARKRVDHDIAYIANFSLALDIKILAKTIKEEFLSGSGH